MRSTLFGGSIVLGSPTYPLKPRCVAIAVLRAIMVKGRGLGTEVDLGF